MACLYLTSEVYLFAKVLIAVSMGTKTNNYFT